MILLFTCVVLHELGHSLVAQKFGLTVREIVLLPIGGVARLEKNPEKPLHELLIAAAGPLVNVAIAVLLFFAGGLAVNFGALEGRSLFQTTDGPPSLVTLWGWLFTANVALALFNLIPAFPMDGGRILRAALALKMGFSRATRIATGVGQAIAFAFGLFGVLSGNLLLVVVAFFVFMGAGQERAEEQARDRPDDPARRRRLQQARPDARPGRPRQQGRRLHPDELPARLRRHAGERASSASSRATTS